MRGHILIVDCYRIDLPTVIGIDPEIDGLSFVDVYLQVPVLVVAEGEVCLPFLEDGLQYRVLLDGTDLHGMVLNLRKDVLIIQGEARQ